jgi:hypothetical protein
MESPTRNVDAHHHRPGKGREVAHLGHLRIEDVRVAQVAEMLAEVKGTDATRQRGARNAAVRIERRGARGAYLHQPGGAGEVPAGRRPKASYGRRSASSVGGGTTSYWRHATRTHPSATALRVPPSRRPPPGRAARRRRARGHHRRQLLAHRPRPPLEPATTGPRGERRAGPESRE